MGMSAREMTRLVFYPHQQAVVGMAGMAPMTAPSHVPGWHAVDWASMIAMWWMMMVAMMVPSAAPAILLYARVHHHASTRAGGRRGLAPTGAFAAGYLLVWLAFSLAAAILHWTLEQSGVISATMMDSRSRWLSTLVLIAVGLYQLTPLKNACLSRCRAPQAFFSGHWRPGKIGALRLGAMHGGFCVGCCWALMVLLFVGGVMNLLWIAVLTCIVLIEKLARRGAWIGRIVGLVLIGWGAATFLH